MIYVKIAKGSSADYNNDNICRKGALSVCLESLVAATIFQKYYKIVKATFYKLL